jgi:small GTP-binding protein
MIAAKPERRRQQHKVVLLGESRVGKTSIINRQFQGFEPTTPTPTIGCHPHDFLFTINDKTFNLQVWDTAGQEMYRALVPVYLRATEGAIVVYDITDRESFNSLGRWCDVLNETVGPETVVFIVANKMDLFERAVVKEEEGMAYAEVHKATFFKASAITGQGIDEIFQTMAMELARKVRADFVAIEMRQNVGGSEKCAC